MVNWKQVKEWLRRCYNIHMYGNPDGIDEGWGGFL